MAFIDVMPLVYNALDSEHSVVSIQHIYARLVCWRIPQVQERALKVVPDLCDTIDYAEVQGVLFPRVAVREAFFMNVLIAEELNKSDGIHKDESPKRKNRHISAFLESRCAFNWSPV